MGIKIIVTLEYVFETIDANLFEQFCNIVGLNSPHSLAHIPNTEFELTLNQARELGLI